MIRLNQLFVAVTLIGTASLANANDGNFASLSYGKTLDQVSQSDALNANLGRPNTAGAIGSQDNTWGLRAGQQTESSRYYATYDYVSGDHAGVKLRQQNLLGSYDAFLPLTSSTRLFGGGTAGITRLTQESPGFSRDSDMGYAIGGQVGVLQQMSSSVSVELGYRYLRSNASVEMAPRGGPKSGSLKLDSTAQTYLAANYAF
jgi:opacity protein-like surface antigen